MVGVSPLAGYQIGIPAGGIQYWNGTGFQPTCPSVSVRSDQLQQLTVSASAPAAEDQLSFVVADPKFIFPPTTVTLTTAISPPEADGSAPPDATTGNQITITATVGPPILTPTGTITWTGPCTPSDPVPGFPGESQLDASGTATCTISNAQPPGYTVAAAYSGDANYQPSSNTIPIQVSAPTQLVFTQQPGTSLNGAPLGPQPVVTIEDSAGNPATSTSGPVTLAITQQPATGASLNCATNPLTATNGVATFAGCQIIGHRGSYTITASAPTSVPPLASATTTFTLNPGAPTQLVFTQQPGTSTNGAPLAPQPVVTVEDSGGNTVASSSAKV